MPIIDPKPKQGRTWKTATLAEIMARFGLTQEDLRDKRISGLAERKLKLNNEISRLIFEGARDQRAEKMAKLLGFTDKEFAADRRKISSLILSVLDSRQYIAGLKPKTITRGAENATRSK